MTTKFVRQSTGRAWGPNSQLVSFAEDELRVGYDPETGKKLGALIEDRDTNFVKSSVFTSADWNTQGSATFSQTDVIAPSGEKAARLSMNVETTRYIETGVLFPYSDENSKRLVNGFLVKPNGGRYVGVVTQQGAAVRSVVYFDLIEKKTVVDNHPSNTVYPDGLGEVFELDDGWFLCRSNQLAMYQTIQFIVLDSFSGTYSRDIEANNRDCLIAGITSQNRGVSPIITSGSILSRSPDVLRAPVELNKYPSGLHTWQITVRTPEDEGEPTVLCTPDSRIYFKDGVIQLDGPGAITQPDRMSNPGDEISFLWDVQFPGGTPPVAIGRDLDDANFWNGYIVDVIPQFRKLENTERALYV